MTIKIKDEDNIIREWASSYVLSVSSSLSSIAESRTDSVTFKLDKVLKAFSIERLAVQHFSSITGYGHGDQGRDVIDKIFARILGAEKALVRLQFVSGTHAISCALFGVLRPGNNLLSITGRPYETLEEVIGLRGSGKGSLRDFGVKYEEISFTQDGKFDFVALENALTVQRDMIFIQRSCGYSWRPSLSIELIGDICKFIHSHQPNCVCFVDNCYGEFVEQYEPNEVGADLVAGSLIKNLGGTIVPTGGYIAGKIDLVEKASYRLNSPGVGVDAGISFDLNRLVLQGLFLAPQMVAEALIGADLVAGVFQGIGFDVLPSPGGHRSDLIQAVHIGDPEVLKIICKSFQRSSPVSSYLEPVPSQMAGYESDLVMAGGTFIDGSTSEFSADAPLREPFNLFVQGGTHRSHIQIALINALSELVKAGFLKMPQNR